MNTTKLVLEPSIFNGAYQTKEPSPQVIDLSPLPPMTDGQFFLFCQANPELRIERSARGEIEIMSPAGGETGSRNAEVSMGLRLWAKRNKQGVAFDSSTGFKLPNGADRSPNASWVRIERLLTLSRQEKQRFLPLCPDFVVELRSPSDGLSNLKAKMEEYIANGTQLGWLLDPTERVVYIYRRNQPVEKLHNPQVLTGDPMLPGFTLELADVWDPGF